MTVLHWLLLALCAAAAIVASDLLSHRGIKPWPVGLATVAVVLLAGWFYSPWLAAAGLGLGTGLAIVAAGSVVKAFLAHRERSQGRAGASGRPDTPRD